MSIAVQSGGRLLAFLLLWSSVSSVSWAQGQSPATQTASRRDQHVLIFVGMPGAGKSTAGRQIADRLGAPMWSSGDVIRQATVDRGLARTAENDRLVAQELASQPGSVGRLVAQTVQQSSAPLVIVEGFRTLADLEAFKRIFPNARLVAVEVGTARRHDRLLSRGRVGENNASFLRARDRAETDLGVRDVMRRADYRVRPRGNDLVALGRSLERMLRQVDAGLARAFRIAAPERGIASPATGSIRPSRQDRGSASARTPTPRAARSQAVLTLRTRR